MQINKQDSVIIKGPVIVPDMKDLTEDISPSPEGIKRIFTNFLNRNVDINHSWVPIEGVHIIESYINEEPIILAKQDIPAKSWIMTMMVTNPDIKKYVTDGTITGYSIGAVTDDAMDPNKLLNKSLSYQEIQDMETLNPLFVSLCEHPASGFVFEKYSYNDFLAKSESFNKLNKIKGEDKLTNGEKISMSENLFEKLFSRLMKGNTGNDTEVKTGEPEHLSSDVKEKQAQNKNGEDLENPKKEPQTVPSKDIKPRQEPPVEEKKINKEECSCEANKEEETVEKEAEPVILAPEVIDAIADAVINRLQALANEQEAKDDADDTVIDKECGKKDEVNKAIEPVNEDKEPSVEKSVPDSKGKNIDTKITKSTTKITEPEPRVVQDTFLNSNTRDEFGRNINYLRN